MLPPQPQDIAAGLLKVTRLRISGFKSFPDPTDVAIDEGLTGIVGPNGCGKSNIVEALRWVMGESSARGVRGAEMDDVIFSGSALRPRFDFAEVTLVLEGPVEGHVGAGAELAVSRRIGRGTGSVYRIGGREARARDVQLLFADVGSGARSAAVVNQGQVTALVDARPDERRRLLEEAAGIGGLLARRREAELRLAATERNLELVVERLAEQERRLAALARQRRQAERFRHLQQELRLLEKLRLLLRLETLRASAAERGRELAELERRHAGLATELEAARCNRGELDEALRAAGQDCAALAAARVRAEERLRARRLALERERGERARLERRIAELETELSAVDGRLADNAARGTELDERRAALEREAEGLRRRLAEEARALEETRGELAAVEDRLRQARVEEGRLAADLEMAERAAAELANRRQALEARLAAMEEELADSPEERATAELAALEERHAGQRRAIAERQEAAARLEETLAGLERARQEAAARCEALRDERERLTTRAREIDAALETVEERRRLLIAALEAAAERRRRLEAERAALQACREGSAVADLARELERAAAARREAEARLEALGRERAELARHRHEAAAERGGCEQERMRVESEIAALEELLPPAAPAPLIDRLDLGEEEGRALMAALGEELLLGTDRGAPAYWREDPAAPRNGADLPLPEGVEPLSGRIAGVPALARRLALIGLTEADRAEALHGRLAPGQVLVCRDGGIWRWDGLVRRPEASAEVIARLDRRQRLGRLRRLLAERQRREREAARRLAGIEARLAAIEREVAALTDRRRGLERQEDLLRHRQETAIREAAEAERRLSAIAEECRALEEERARLGEQERALAAEAERLRGERPAEETLAEVRERHAAATEEAARRAREAAAARAALEHAAAELAELRRREAALAEEIATGRRELAAAGERLAGLRAMLEAGRSERAALEKEAAAHGAAAARIRRLLEEAAERCRALEAERAALCGALEETERRHRRIADRLTAIDREGSVIVGERTHLSALAEELAARRERLHQSLEASRRERHLLAAPEGEEATAELEAELARLAGELAAREEERQRLEGALATCRERVELLAAAAGELREGQAGLRGELARLEGEREAVEREIRERLGRPARAFLEDPALREALDGASMAEIEPRIEALKRARERLGEVNLRAAREHAELEETVAATRAEEAELRAAVERLRDAIATLDREGRRRLLAAFETVDRHFRELFRRLFGGGEAHLRLTRLDEPFAAGLELEAMPPGKKLQHVSLLSGGEKSLAALALVFAFFLARPSPLCVLDEVDAALDDANVERFLALMSDIAERTGTRFLVVTHHPLTMARMDRLYGVTMTEPGVSRLVSVVLETAVALRATA